MAIVTGANCGLGLRAAELLCQAGVHVIVACRCVSRGTQAVNQITTNNPNANVSFMQVSIVKPQRTQWTKKTLSLVPDVL